MAKIEREYYSINEASEIICCSVADLVHLATKGEVKFIVLTSGLPAQRIRQNIIEEKQPYEYINEKFCYVSQDNVAVFEANHSNDDLYITWVYTDDDLEHGWGLHASSVIPMTHESLYMLTADINALLSDHPEIDDGRQQVNIDAGDAGTGTKPLNQFDNEFQFSGLLNLPDTKDDWVEVIDAMTKEYYLEFNNSMPTEAQAWVRLCENPPTGYGITANKDNLSITMIGIVKPLNKRAFNRRWAKYTAKSSQI